MLCVPFCIQPLQHHRHSVRFTSVFAIVKLLLKLLNVLSELVFLLPCRINCFCKYAFVMLSLTCDLIAKFHQRLL